MERVIDFGVGSNIRLAREKRELATAPPNSKFIAQ
jgi:hypothetical protein